jgi:hypothetical protein
VDAAWIKVVVLTLAECVAPQGKTVCQNQEAQYYFVDEAECQKVLEQLIDYRDGFDNVIVDKQASGCRPAARNLEVFESRADADPNFVESESQGIAGAEPKKKDFIQERHDLRLQSLPVCDDEKPVTPCKRGEIIIESMAGNKTEIWKQSQ